MIVDILPTEHPGRPFEIVVDHSYLPAGPDYCPGTGEYFPDTIRWLGPDLVMPHASIRVYGRRWVVGRKIIYRVCPSCDYREFDPTKRKGRWSDGRR